MKHITNYADIHEDARYYRKVYNRQGKDRYIQYTRFYDKNFTVIEDADVRYLRVLDGLTRICTPYEAESQMALDAYDLHELESGYYSVTENPATAKNLELMAEAIGRYSE